MNRFRSHFTLNHVEGKLYAIGGHRFNGNLAGSPAENTAETGSPCERTVEEHDLETNTWTMTAMMPNSNGLQR